MAYRDDADALHARHALLSSIRIATPCDASWDAMAGDDRVRHCALCDRQVYDLARMTSAEAFAVIESSGEQLPCVRLHRRRDGTVITSDCARGVSKRRRHLAIATATVACAASVAAFGDRALEALRPRSPAAIEDRADVTMGETVSRSELEDEAQTRDAMEQVDDLLRGASGMGRISSSAIGR